LTITLRKLDASLERQIIMGMVVSDVYLKSIAPIYNADYLTATFSRTVANWCLEYLDKYGSAPSFHLEDIFNSRRRERAIEEDQAELIENFLSGLSEEYERKDKFNVEYLLDQTEKFFRQRELGFAMEDVKACLADGDLEEAELVIAKFKRVTRPVDQGIYALDNEPAILDAFVNKSEPLFRLKGAYGDMVSPHMIREGFVAFLGRAKVGKTWRLMDIADAAVEARCNVAMFQTGDLTQKEYIRRQSIHYAKISDDVRYCGVLHIPVLDCEINQHALECPRKGINGNTESVYTKEGVHDKGLIGKHVPCTRCRKEWGFKGAVWYTIREPVKPLTGHTAAWHTREWKEKKKASQKLKLLCRTNTTINVKGIEAQLDMWEQYDNWLPDVIIIDYADLLMPEDSRKDDRGIENDRWKALRRLSQERHVLVVTATQANRTGFNEETLQVSNMSEDKRKVDHVTAFFALNQSEEEEELGLIRVSNMLVREGKRDVGRQVRVLQSLETGQAYIDSYNYYPKRK
jgi:hypothetical protein